MTVALRAYSDYHDHVRVMNFLRETFRETGNLENWLPPRFENNSRELDIGINIWEDDREIVGFVVPEKPLVYFVQLHPTYIWL